MKIILSALFILLSSNFAHAQQYDNSFGDWKVFTHKQDGKKVCYMASIPVKQRGSYTKRGEPFFLVTSKGENHDEINVSSGYPYKEGREVEMLFPKNRFKLFIKGERAWAYDGDDDNIVKSMIKESKVVVEGISWKNTNSTDTYSLKGFTKAHKRMKQLCR